MENSGNLTRNIILETNETYVKEYEGKINTEEKIWIPSNRDMKEKSRIIAITDYADKGDILLRSSSIGIAIAVDLFSHEGKLTEVGVDDKKISLTPCLHFVLPDYSFLQKKFGFAIGKQAKNDKSFDIRQVRDNNGNIYQTLNIGEYPITKVDENLNRKLEAMYND